jgi:hypothetical protein
MWSQSSQEKLEQRKEIQREIRKRENADKC